MPTLYLPFRQEYVGWMTLHVRTSNMRRTTEVIAAVRAAPRARRVRRDLADEPDRGDGDDSGAGRRRRDDGVHGGGDAAGGSRCLRSGRVQRRARMRELGVRKAIGATTADLIRLVVGENIALTMTGLAAGAVVGVLGATVLRTFIAGVSPLDPITLISTAVLISGSTVVASALPAFRAAVVNPLIALRDS